MDGDPAHRQTVQSSQFGKELSGAIDRDAELVLALAGRDLGVGARVDVGVNAERADGAFAACAGEERQLVAFLLALDVELADAGVEPLDQLFMGLAHAGEHDFARRDASRQRARELAARHHIGAISLAAQHAQHRKVGIGLDRKGQMRIVEAIQPLTEGARLSDEQRARINVDGGSHRLGDRGQGNVLGVHHAIAQGKGFHGRAFAQWRAAVDTGLLCGPIA